MSTKITSLDDIIKALRAQLILQSGLDENAVLNGESKKGATPYHKIGGDIFQSFDSNGAFIIFDLQEYGTTNDIIEPTEDNTILNYQSYRLHLSIYGEQASTVAAKIKSRFLTEEVIEDLLEKDIAILQPSQIERKDEFINDCHWHRADLNIDLTVVREFNKATIKSPYKEINLNIRKH